MKRIKRIIGVLVVATALMAVALTTPIFADHTKGTNGGVEVEVEIDQANDATQVNGTQQKCEAEAEQEENENISVFGTSTQTNINTALCANVNVTGQAIDQENEIEVGGDNGGGNSGTDEATAEAEGTNGTNGTNGGVEVEVEVSQENDATQVNGTQQKCEAEAEQEENTNLSVFGDATQTNDNLAECVNLNVTDQTIEQENEIEG